MSNRNLETVVRSFQKKRILLIGDLIIDVHHEGTAVGMSSEAPIMVYRHDASVISYGGAGLVAANILALGGQVTFLSVVGDDEYVNYAMKFSHKNLEKEFFVEKGRPTIVKERFLVNGRKIFRWDHSMNAPVSKKTEGRIASFVKAHLAPFDVLVISDYRHGLISGTLSRALIRTAEREGVPVYVDSQMARSDSGRRSFLRYRRATLMCLNQKEAKKVLPDFSVGRLKKSLVALKGILGVGAVVVKLGDRGSAQYIGGKYSTTPAYKVFVVDPVGAGDAFLAALALCGEPPTEAGLIIANVWAGLATSTRGTTPPAFPALLAALRNIKSITP